MNERKYEEKKKYQRHRVKHIEKFALMIIILMALGRKQTIPAIAQICVLDACICDTGFNNTHMRLNVYLGSVGIHMWYGVW